MLVSIVIPCYNSEQTIEKVVNLTIEEFDKMPGYECEFVLVNDYSKDQTYEAIKRAAAKHSNVTGINLAKNAGQHAAIMCGLHYVKGEMVLGMDDDLQTHPSQIRKFLEKAEEGYDIVFGVFEKRKFSLWKNFIGHVSRQLLWKLTNQPKDIRTSNFWLARRFIVDRMCEYTGPYPMIQLLLIRYSSSMADINVEHFSREVGTSNYTFRKGLKLFLSFLNYSTIPLTLISWLGMGLSALGAIGAVIILIRKLVDPGVMLGWSSLMFVMLLLFGLLFLILGVLGEYIGRLSMTQNREPQYVLHDMVKDGVNEDLTKGNAVVDRHED